MIELPIRRATLDWRVLMCLVGALLVGSDVLVTSIPGPVPWWGTGPLSWRGTRAGTGTQLLLYR